MITKGTVVNGLFWSGMSMGSDFGVNLLVKLILAYYLLPEHFGLIGMAAAATALIQVFSDMGVGAALIQRKEEHIQPIHWTSAYWLNLVVNWICFAVIALVASPLAAFFFHEEQLRLLIVGLSISLLIQPFVFVQRIRLNKEMKFKHTFIAETVGSICGGVAGVLLAVNGFGVWSFVGQGLTSSFVRCPAYHLMVPWRPTFRFSLRATKTLMSFGFYDTCIRLLGYAHNHLNIIILGCLFSPVIVGYFAFARSFTVSLINPINRLFKKVFFPFFSGIQNDTHRIKRYYLAQIQHVTMFIFPISVAIFILAPDFIDTIWGEKWQGAIFPSRLLPVFMVIMAVGCTPGTILKSTGRIKLTLKLQILDYFVVKIPLVLLGGIFYGFGGFIIAIVLSQIIIFFIEFNCIRRHIDLNIKEIISTISNNVYSSVVMGLCLYLLTEIWHNKDVFVLSFFALLGAVIYFGVHYMFKNMGLGINFSFSKIYKLNKIR